ncbi:MAG: HEPN domain-containing protein [Bacteroidetes bacterium]|nr:HEPN domain-containing protein [Bacteroidota bacterium]
MMDKEKHIQYWLLTAIDDSEAVIHLYEAGKYVQALFFTHLFLEKILKAHWVKDNDGNVPPKIHNLMHLYERTTLELSDDEKIFLRRMNTFQLEGRYPDYHASLHKIMKKTDTEKILTQAKELFICLQEKLQ